MKPGQILQEKYQIDAELSSKGGFGIVYLGTDLTDGKKVAVKEIKAQQINETSDADATRNTAEESWEKKKEEFLEEAEILRILGDVPQVVKVYSSRDEGNTAYIVLEYLEGRTLKEASAHGKKRPAEEAYRIITELLSILEKVHNHRIIHRDIAPDNLFLLSAGRMKLFDFGIAHAFGEDGGSKPWVDAKKKGYTPLEQLRKSKMQNAATDVYAAAVTYYEMLTGIRPPDADDRKTKDKIILPSKAGAPISPEEEQILLKALAVEPKDRIQTAAEFAALLREVHEKKKRRFRNRMSVIAAGIAVFIGLSFLSLRLLSQNPADTVVNVEVMSQSPTDGETGAIQAREGRSAGAEDENTGEGNQTQASLADTAELSGIDAAAADQTIVPDVTGMTEAEAAKELQKSELSYIKRAEISQTVPKGEIIRQEPATGSQAERDSQVQIWISLGEKEQESTDPIVTLAPKTTEAPITTKPANNVPANNPVVTEPYYAEPTISDNIG